MCRGQRRGWTTGHSAQRATGHRPCGPNQPRTLLKWAGNARHIRVSSCQFQALFNSLFKVLCIFPSRYLFAIGLSPIFSFRWNLPLQAAIPSSPTRQERIVRPSSATAQDSHLLRYPVPRDLSDGLGRWRLPRLQFRGPRGPPDLKRELCPLHSPLLRASWLVSFPPLSDMLKFSG